MKTRMKSLFRMRTISESAGTEFFPSFFCAAKDVLCMGEKALFYIVCHGGQNILHKVVKCGRLWYNHSSIVACGEQIGSCCDAQIGSCCDAQSVSRCDAQSGSRCDARSRKFVQLLYGTEKNSSIFHGSDIACPAVWNIMAKNETIFAEGV